MATYQVFVERPSSPAADAHGKLAAAMAERYGLARNDLEPRLRAGRFRVKNNVDLATAERFAADLEQLGAVVSVVDASGAPLARARTGTAPARPAPAPAPDRPASAATKPPAFQTGLAAAFGATSDATDLGALGGESGEFALSALDGTDDHPATPGASGSFAPPPSSSSGGLPASIGPAIARAPAAAAPAAAKSDELIDMFAPPTAEAPVDLAVDMEDMRAKRASVPPLPARAPVRSTMQPPTHVEAAATAAAGSAAPTARDRLRAFAAHDRARFATGALLAVVLGFVPAAIVTSVRERSAFAEIDGHLADKQARVRSLEDWNALDRVRDAAHDEKLAEKHSIALTSVLLWAAVSAGLAFVWFRKIDWDRLAAG